MTLLQFVGRGFHERHLNLLYGIGPAGAFAVIVLELLFGAVTRRTTQLRLALAR